MNTTITSPHPTWCAQDACVSRNWHRGATTSWEVNGGTVEVTVGLIAGVDAGDRTDVRVALHDLASVHPDPCGRPPAADMHLDAGEVDRLIAALQAVRAQLDE